MPVCFMNLLRAKDHIYPMAQQPIEHVQCSYDSTWLHITSIFQTERKKNEEEKQKMPFSF